MRLPKGSYLNVFAFALTSFPENRPHFFYDRLNAT